MELFDLAALLLAGWALGAWLGRMVAARAPWLAGLLVLAAVLPFPGRAGLAANLVALVALPLGWGLRRRPLAARQVLRTLAGPARRAAFWLPALAPWLGLGLVLAAARLAVGRL